MVLGNGEQAQYSDRRRQSARMGWYCSVKHLDKYKEQWIKIETELKEET